MLISIQNIFRIKQTSIPKSSNISVKCVTILQDSPSQYPFYLVGYSFSRLPPPVRVSAAIIFHIKQYDAEAPFEYYGYFSFIGDSRFRQLLYANRSVLLALSDYIAKKHVHLIPLKNCRK